MIELKNVKKTYRMGAVDVHALQGVSVKVEQGEFIAIMGPSGSGKSTLMHLLGFLDKPDSGEYFLYDKNVTSLTEEQYAILRNRSIGFIFQQFHLLARVSAIENVELPLIYAGKRGMQEKAVEKLKIVNLDKRMSHEPNELSGGEQQRIAIARALVNEPFIIMADEPTGNLDTRNQNEIMEIMTALNRDGKTIVLVTHEEEVAEYAKRIIRMRDGKIVSDEVKAPSGKAATIPAKKVSIDDILCEKCEDVKRAEFVDHLKQAFWSIFSHKLRSGLSMLGILIGVAAVIAMMALGQGAKESISQTIASMGSNLLMLRSGSHRLHGIAMESGTVTRFNFQDVDAVKKIAHVEAVSPNVQGRGQLVYGNKNWNTQIQGTGVDYALMRAAVPKVGRFFSAEELRARRRVAVIGTTVARELFGEENPIGAFIKVNRISFQVIGVLPAKGMAMFRDQDDVIIMPVTTAMYRVLGKQYIDSIDIEVDDMSNMDAVQEHISNDIMKRRRLGNDDEKTFEIRNMADLQATLQSTTKTMTMLLGSIAAISLLVGGIGIMNIMLVSVTERTREIGLRKAIGARSNDIMLQFLIESVTMTFTGGMIGVALGAGMALMLATSAGWAVKVSMFSIVLATTFSVLVGVVFGLWPAYQASRLNPIEALRYE